MTHLQRRARLVADAVKLRYGSGPGSAWAHMSPDQRDDAVLAAAARLLQSVDGEKYIPAVEFLDLTTAAVKTTPGIGLGGP